MARMDAASHFKGKKITVMGLGLLGRGVGDIRFLAESGADLIVTDLKSAVALEASLLQLKEFKDITYILGEHRLEDFRDRDLVLKAAGVPLNSPFIREARNAGIPIKMSASLFAEIAKIPIVGITGTRGKSTTTHMIHAILQKANKKILLGGNVRGVSTLALLPEATKEHIALFELDSWQLQGFGEEKISPEISVFTTFFPDHLNYYNNDLDAYLADKANIFLYQRDEDSLVLGSQCADLVNEKYGSTIHSKVFIVDTSNLPSGWRLSVPGEHNRYDAALARQVALLMGINDLIIRDALESFTAVSGRLELVRSVNGVDFYNDTTATTPDATLTALRALQANHPKKIILIMGGADKGIEMSELITAIPLFAKRVIYLSGTGTARIQDSLPQGEIFDSLQSAFEHASTNAEEGDAILLSPAFASFGMFKNEFDRGDQFNHLVQSL